MRQTIAVLTDIDPSGGGSHQWALNILYALDDYRAARGDVDVVVMHYRPYPPGHPLQKIFPAFRFLRIGKAANLLSKLLRRLAVAVPVALPLLRRLFPLNYVAAGASADCVLFPVNGLDAVLCQRRNIFCIADIAHVYYPHFPEVRENGQLRLREVLFRHGLANASCIMVESEQLGREIVRVYGADPIRIHVVFQVLPRHFDRHAGDEDGLPVPRPYLFYPAQLWAHKNHRNLLIAFASLAGEFADLTLVLSGSRKPGDEATFAQIESLGLKERVIYLGYVSDARIPALYRNAAALVMPTYFGPSNIPTLEAFAFGTPAVISDLPGVEEQVRDAALRFDPDDAADIADKLRLVLRDQAFADEMVARGRRRIGELNYENFRDAMAGLFDCGLKR